MLHSLGLLSRRNVRATEDADIVLLMKEAGAILLAVTSVPEINLWCETRNHLIGQTKNPYNTTRTTGGSSGGEVSLFLISFWKISNFQKSFELYRYYHMEKNFCKTHYFLGCTLKLLIIFFKLCVNLFLNFFAHITNNFKTS